MISDLIPAIACLVLLSVNGLRDLKRMEIFPVFTLLFGGMGFVWQLANGNTCFLLLSWIPGIMVFLLSRISKGKIGMGDGLVLLGLGCWLDLFQLILLLTLALLLVCLWQLIRSRKRQKALPFIPFLLAGYVLQGLLF